MKRNIILGKNIQALRKQHGYTQVKLAEKIGVHSNYISQIERCEKDASIKTLEKLKNALHATWIQLLEPNDEITGTPKRRNKKKENEIRKIKRYLENLDKKNTKLVLNLVRTIANKN